MPLFFNLIEERIIKVFFLKTPGSMFLISHIKISPLKVFISFAGGVIVFLLLTSAAENNNDSVLLSKAEKICRESIVLDAHIDWPEWLTRYSENISGKAATGDFDYYRAYKGGLNAAFSVAYISARLNEKKGRLMLDSMVNIVHSYIKTYPDKFAAAFSPADVRHNFRKNLISLPLCVENGSLIGNDLSYISYLKEKGIVYITLNHNKSNNLGDANLDKNRIWNGLSPFGRQAVSEMNRLGIIIDISHSSDSTAYQAIRLSTAPVIASHSGCRTLTPGFERNLSDNLIKEIARKKGLIMVYFYSTFIDPQCRRNARLLLEWCRKNNVNINSVRGIAVAESFPKTGPVKSYSSVVADHIEHIIRIAGIDYVGIGSDFSGMGPFQPYDLPDVSAYKTLVYELLKRGFSENDIKKILGENFLRVWDEVLSSAESIKSNNHKKK